MDKDYIRKVIIIFTVMIIGINLWDNYSIKKEVQNLRDDYSRLENNIYSNIENIRYNLQDEYENIEELLKKEQSIFSQASVELKIQDDQIAVTMQAVPKEITNTEKLIARIAADGQVYEQEVNANNEAVILVDMVSILKPMFVIKSERGVRQEALEPVYTNDILQCTVLSEWDYGEESSPKEYMGLKIQFGENEEGLPFDEKSIESAEFILKENGYIEEGNSNYSYGASQASAVTNSTYIEEDYSELLQGKHIPALKQAGEDDNRLIYTADFAEYIRKEDSIYYEVYFTLRTKSGMQYITPYNTVATFSSSKNSSNMGSGESVLVPIF